MSSQGAGEGSANTALPQAGRYADPGRVPRWGEIGMPARDSMWWRVLWIGGGLLLVLLLIWGLTIWDAAAPAGGRFAQGGPMPVGVAKAQSGDMPITLNALGTVTPLATVTVRPQVSGPIVKFDFQEGQMVKAGDVLAEIDPRPYQAALDQVKGTLAKDKAALANAITDLHRYQALYAADKAISQQILATQQALVGQDQGTIVTDQANIEAADLNVQYTKITSPVAGRVGIRQVDLGNLVQAGQTNGIVVVTQMQPMSVVFSLPEDNIGEVASRVNSGAKLEADAYDRAQTQQLATGTLTAVDSEIDPTTGTVKIRATFDNTDSALFPQQFVNIKLLVDTLHGQTLVPPAAIQRGAQGTFVYVVKPDKTVEMRGVTLGAANAQFQSITQGLKPGDTVVVDGADRLKDDAKVIIPASSAAIAAPSAAGGAQDAISAQRAARFQKMLKMLPHDQAAALQKMTPDQRRAWFKAHRGQFPHRHGGGGGGP
jgi:multidrug efflux system membrane fusion protein